VTAKTPAYTDVLVTGAGPAGAVAALNLATDHQVLIIDRDSDYPLFRVGESLPAAARRLFRDMQLLEAFEQQVTKLPSFGHRSAWASEQLQQSDSMADLDGHGWHLDRAGFDRWLRQQALQRGAMLMPGTTAGTIQRTDTGWRVELKQEGQPPQLIECRLLIDAAGRNCPVARQVGAERIVLDKLVCCWQLYNSQAVQDDAGFSCLEAVWASL